MNRQCKLSVLPYQAASLLISYTDGTNRGTAYILYALESEASRAISHMHESQLDGAVISVSVVIPRRRFSPSPPPARRGPGFGGGGMRPGMGRAPEPKRDRRSSRGSRGGYRADSYRPRSLSRSRSPRKHRSRSRSYSRSQSPPRRRRRDSPERNGGRKRSMSRDSYVSRRTLSRSPIKSERR